MRENISLGGRPLGVGGVFRYEGLRLPGLDGPSNLIIAASHRPLDQDLPKDLEDTVLLALKGTDPAQLLALSQTLLPRFPIAVGALVAAAQALAVEQTQPQVGINRGGGGHGGGGHGGGGHGPGGRNWGEHPGGGHWDETPSRPGGARWNPHPGVPWGATAWGPEDPYFVEPPLVLYGDPIPMTSDLVAAGQRALEEGGAYPATGYASDGALYMFLVQDGALVARPYLPPPGVGGDAPPPQPTGIPLYEVGAEMLRTASHEAEKELEREIASVKGSVGAMEPPQPTGMSIKSIEKPGYLQDPPVGTKP